MKKYLDRAKIESIHGELYNPFNDPDSDLRSNYCISDQGKIFLLEHVQNLGIIKDGYVELKVQIYNTSTSDAVIESVRLSYERGPLDNSYLPEFIIPPLNYYNFSHRIPAHTLPHDFYILILSFFVRGENTEKLKIFFSKPETSTVKRDFEDTEFANTPEEIFVDTSDAIVINPKRGNMRITLPRSNPSGLFKMSSDYKDSRYLMGKFENGLEIMIPPSGEYFSTQNHAFNRNSFQLKDDKGRVVNTLTACDIIVDRTSNVYYRRNNKKSFYKLFIEGFSDDLHILGTSEQVKIQQFMHIKQKLHLVVFSRVISGEACIDLKDRDNIASIDIEFEDDVQPLRVLDVPFRIHGTHKVDSRSIHFSFSLTIEGVGSLKVITKEKSIEHKREVTSSLIDPQKISYNLSIPKDIFDLNGNYNLSLGFFSEDGTTVWYDVLCRYESKGRIFPDSQIGPIILSYGTIQEKQIQINLPPGEELIRCEINLSGIEGDLSPVSTQKERVFSRLNEIIEYSHFGDCLVLRFSCFSPLKEYLTKISLSVSIQTNKSQYLEYLNTLIFYYEGQSKFYLKKEDGYTILKCHNSGEEQLIIYRICTTHQKAKIDHLFSDMFFPVKIEANESQSFVIFDTEEIKEPLELSIYYNNPTPKIIKLEV